MTPAAPANTDPLPARIAAALLALSALALWLPALATPWWGDDYMFLGWARASRLAGEAWWAAFWPDAPFQFWRPISQEAWWRLVEGPLGASALWAHGGNALLWLLACAATGWFAATLARALHWPRPKLDGLLAAAVYGVLAVHFIPLHWVSAANSSTSVLFTALALALWTASPGLPGGRRALACAGIVLLQVLALLSKESGALLPLLFACITALLWPLRRPGLPEAVTLVACLAAIGIWLVLRARFALPAMPEYRLVLGVNVLRNTAALGAWLLNVPREALRLVATGSPVLGLLWAAAAAVPMLAFIALGARGVAADLSRRQWSAVAVFVLLAYAPYFALAWQAYEYYAATAVLLPAVLLAHGLGLSARAPVAALCLAVSSLVAVQGSRSAADPALIGRARWAERQLRDLARQPVARPLPVYVTDDHRFSAIGVAGLAWRLGVPVGEISLVKACPPNAARWLVQQADGDFHWEPCQALAAASAR